MPLVYNYLEGKKFDSYETITNELIQCEISEDESFFEREIVKLTQKWSKVMEQNGQYIMMYVINI